MKKIYILTLFIILVNQMNAQLVLTKAAFEPVIGDFYDAKTIDTTSTLPMGITGSSVTWNVSGVSESGALNTNNYSSPSSYPGASTTYPGVTMVKEDMTTADLSYFKVTPTTFELVGAYFNAGIVTADLNYNTNSAILYSYPVGMGYTNTDIGAGSIVTSSLTGVFTSTIETVADGSGTLAFNGAVSLSNCLRVRIKQHIEFSFLAGAFIGTVDQDIYNYYQSSTKHPVFTVSYSHVVSPGFSLGGIPPINNYQARVETHSSVVIGIKESHLNDVNFRTYPNPTKNEFSIYMVLTKNENYTVEVINTLGQIVKTISLPNLTPGMYNHMINVSELTSGLYTIKLKGNNATGTQKLIIE